MADVNPPPAPNPAPSEEAERTRNLRRLAEYLRLAGKTGRGTILLVVYRSEFVRAEAERELVAALQNGNEQPHIVRVRVQAEGETADIPRFVRDHPEVNRAIFFVYNLSAGGMKSLRLLNYRRELLVEAGARVLLWLTEGLFAQVAREAPDFFAFRGRTVTFLEQPDEAQLQTLSSKLAPHDGWSEFADHKEAAEGIALRRSLLAELPDEPQFALQRAELQDRLATLLMEVGQYEEAKSLYEEALHTRQAVLEDEKHPDIATSLNNLGEILRITGEYERAKQYFEQALVVQESLYGQKHPSVATTLSNLGLTLEKIGQYRKAIKFLEKSLELRRKLLGEKHKDTATSLNNLGALLESLGQYEEAKTYFEQALGIRQKVLGQEHVVTAKSYNKLGYLMTNYLRDFVTARSLYEHALAIRKSKLGIKHKDTATSLNNLAVLCYHEGNYATAADLMAQALAIREEVLGPDHPYTQQSRRSLDQIRAAL